MVFLTLGVGQLNSQAAWPKCFKVMDWTALFVIKCRWPAQTLAWRTHWMHLCGNRCIYSEARIVLQVLLLAFATPTTKIRPNPADQTLDFGAEFEPYLLRFFIAKCLRVSRTMHFPSNVFTSRVILVCQSLTNSRVPFFQDLSKWG